MVVCVVTAAEMMATEVPIWDHPGRHRVVADPGTGNCRRNDGPDSSCASKLGNHGNREGPVSSMVTGSDRGEALPTILSSGEGSFNRDGRRRIGDDFYNTGGRRGDRGVSPRTSGSITAEETA